MMDKEKAWDDAKAAIIRLGGCTPKSWPDIAAFLLERVQYLEQLVDDGDKALLEAPTAFEVCGEGWDDVAALIPRSEQQRHIIGSDTARWVIGTLARRLHDAHKRASEAHAELEDTCRYSSELLSAGQRKDNEIEALQRTVVFLSTALSNAAPLGKG